MWVLTGPFDAEDTSSHKSKLLKAGNTYSLGRKNQPLLIQSKKVSQLHCRFVVQQVSLEDVHVPEKRPKVTFHNERDKMAIIKRAGREVTVEAKSTCELQDEDTLAVVSGLTVTINWQPICCYSPSLQGRSSIPLETCRQLGISIVYTPNPHVTHHILPTYIASASVATSLVSAAQLVKLEWLLEILKNTSALEENFVIPSLSKFRPTFSPSLNPSQKVFKVWEPNEERLSIFSEHRFLVFGEKAREIESDLRELIKRAGGFLETFDVVGGTTKLHRALTRGQAKEGRQLVVVADAKDMKAVIGQEEWEKLVAEVQSFDLHITHPETVVQSVLDIDTSLLTARQPSPVGTNIVDSNISGTSSLPVCVPNTIHDEASIPPEEVPAKKRLLRRAASRQPSVEPASGLVNEEAAHETPKPRRLLLSRRGRPVEPTDSVELSSRGPDDQVAAAPVAPTPGRLRLKRRLGATPTSGVAADGGVVESQLPDILPSVDDEPPLKKFKALFEASDPNRNGTYPYAEDTALSTNTGVDLATQTQSQSEGFVRRPATRSTLTALREEEEEESVPPTGQTQRGTKRKSDSAEREEQDVEMLVAENDGIEGQPMRKRQALESGSHVQKANELTNATTGSPRKEKERNAGAPVGKPDTDVEFLKAVASTKKGKRAEDAFDREFNNLRISKPKTGDNKRQQTGEEEEEWRKFADFGDDAGLRGNFMVVLEMDVHQRKDGERNEGDDRTTIKNGRAVLDQWKDQPNFKKFKKKVQPTRRALLELVVNQDNDFDAAPTNWRNKKSTQTQRTASFPEIKTNSQKPPSRIHTIGSVISDDDSDGKLPKIGKRNPSLNRTVRNKPLARTSSHVPSLPFTSKPSSQASSVMYSKHTSTKPSGQALFLDSGDDDIEEVDAPLETQSDLRGGNDDDDETEQTLRSSGMTRKPVESLEVLRPTPAAGGRKRRAVATDDDSDDGAVFKGFGAGRRKRVR